MKTTCFEEHVYGNVSYTPVILSRSQSREMVSRDLHRQLLDSILQNKVSVFISIFKIS